MDDGLSGLKSERHMIVGIPKHRRPYEYRVGLPPAGVSLFLQHGHRVYVESGAGVGAGFRDQAYGGEGAQIAYSAEELFGGADLALKFARPLREELESMREGAALAGFLHLAAAREDKLLLIAQKQLTALAYELVQEESGGARQRARERLGARAGTAARPRRRPAHLAGHPAQHPPGVRLCGRAGRRG